jgi:uncharacterized DUF497 family protein
MIFGDPLSASMPDHDSADEERWVTLGQTPDGNLVLVIHTWTDIDADSSAVRIISARRPTRNEAHQYREGRTP